MAEAMAETAAHIPATTKTRRLRLGYGVLAIPASLFLAIFFLVPIASVLAISVTDPTPGLQNYALLFTRPSVQRVILTTLQICGITTLASVAIGYLIAYVLIHSRPRTQQWMVALVLVPFWTSVLVRSFAWLMLLGDNGPLNQGLMALHIISEPLGLVRSRFGVCVGMVHYMIPYAVLPLLAQMRGIDDRVMLAARGLGARRGAVFRRVYFPMTLPGVASATILVFIFSFGFYITPAILGGGKVVMIAEYVSVQLLQVLAWGVATMMAVTLVAIVLATLLLAGRVVNLREMLEAR
jgi:putative spermidine/putrescine transport system permease protein